MLVLHCFLLYFCGVQEQIDEFESNETFFEDFHSNACIYEIFFVPLRTQTTNINLKHQDYGKSYFLSWFSTPFV